MRFSNSFLDEIRDRVPISQVVGTRVTFDRRKTNASRGDYWACCPFHGENTPSFHCEDRKGRYHCFGCGVSGDHFRFLSELDGISFPEAVERVADMAGVPMPERDAQAEKREKERASLTDVMDMAAGFFQDMLQGQAGAAARSYLRGRGLSSATQQAFRLGYAPSSRNALKEFLAGKGVGKEQIEACGLVVFGPDIPVSYDRFRDRIMFPIEDARGRVIAFGGRALSADVPAKYLNSPDTELFHKGNVLYNLARARRAAAKGGSVIAVEGYMDAIGLAQAGFDNAVAPLGTALTENQLDLLWRMSGEPVLCFDGDEAGLRAAWRAADLALPLVKPGRSLRFVMLPEGKDPDDIVREAGPDAFAAMLSNARPLADLLWMRETSGKVFDTPERRAELEKNLQALTGRIADEDLRRHYAQDMRERARTFFGGDSAPRRGQGGGFREGGQSRPSGRPGAASGRFAVSESLARSALVRGSTPTMPLREAVLMVSLVNHPELIDAYFDAVEQMTLASGDLARLRLNILDTVAHNRTHDRALLMAKIEEAGLAGIWAQAELRVKSAYQWPALETAALDDAREAFAQTLHLHRRASSLHKELKAAELALATDWNEEDARHLVEIQAELGNLQATEALIEGFGVLSGRANRS
ncbi:DNA primase [Nitratireductor pacificus]|uniref:DNA primase n=1 Tax=Nitratireductor pacificus pht-3B TaxID=391937 RepID=K2LJT2_9HYPH|nr:DNA primase [Nitratireductor pacificus]EKF18004.1 DNA primase [Nitratireductor pacificus pht-3B]